LNELRQYRLGFVKQLRLAKFSHPQACPKLVTLAKSGIVLTAIRAVIRTDAEPIPDLLEFAGQALRVPEKPLFFVETLAFPLAGEGRAVMLFIFESWIGPEQFVAIPAPVFSFCHRRIPPVGRIIDAIAQEEDQD